MSATRRPPTQTLSVSWTISWNAQWCSAGSATCWCRARVAKVAGSVHGRTVRDYCDEPQDLPTTASRLAGHARCDGALGVRSNGLSAPSGGGTLLLRGPEFAARRSRATSASATDQLVARVLAPQSLLAKVATSLRRYRRGRTRHPAPDVHYQGTRTCSAFPHIYDGIVYLYDCEDTLVSGREGHDPARPALRLSRRAPHWWSRAQPRLATDPPTPTPAQAGRQAADRPASGRAARSLDRGRHAPARDHCRPRPRRRSPARRPRPPGCGTRRGDARGIRQTDQRALMTPLRTGVPGARRALAEARGLVRDACS